LSPEQEQNEEQEEDLLPSLTLKANEGRKLLQGDAFKNVAMFAACAIPYSDRAMNGSSELFRSPFNSGVEPWTFSSLVLLLCRR
jgi:hypothetical protein